MNKQVKHIVFTGGPCAGKTTGLSYMSQKLSDRGFFPLLVPEIPTLLMLGNLKPDSVGNFQKHVIKMMLQMEEVFSEAAEECSHPRPVILHDRGIPDAKAWMTAENYKKALDELGLDEVEVRDKRYDGVCHMQTAAIGAEAYYSNATNSVRFESLEEARMKDRATLNAWTGQPHLRVIENEGDFASKLHRLDKEMCHLLGIPAPIQIQKKYLCRTFDPALISTCVHCERIEIEQIYLRSDDPEMEIRVRKRGQNDSFVYFETKKRPVPYTTGTRLKTERFIEKEDWEYAQPLRDPTIQIIRKDRFCFVSDGQYFELDRIKLRDGIIFLLEIELTEAADKVKLPEFLPVKLDVTGDPQYSNRALATLGTRK